MHTTQSSRGFLISYPNSTLPSLDAAGNPLQSKKPTDLTGSELQQKSGEDLVKTVKDADKQGSNDSSLKIKIDLDLDVEVHLTARVKGHIVIGLL